MSTISKPADLPTGTGTMISCVERAKATATAPFDATEIIDAIRSDTRFKLREPITNIREKFWGVMNFTGNDRKKAKKAIDGLKKDLPAAMWSGIFGRRKAGELLRHSGLLCADLDGLGEHVADVRQKLQSSLHLWALFLSPTGDGLKCVFRVAADAARHKDSFRAVEDHVRTVCGIQIDESCSDVSRLCFLSHDEDVYFNEAAVELPPMAEAAPKRIVQSSVGDARLKRRQEIASGLLDEMDWTEPDIGYCRCPGQDLHTAKDGERDCQVYIDGVPTISCFHNSCRGTLDMMNRELRSRIGKAEHAAGSEIEAVNGDKFDKKPGAPVSPPFALPPIIALADFLAVPLEMPSVVVEGMIRERSVVQVASASKSYKTWLLLDLGLSVAQGCAWLGRQVTKGRVLFLNFELTPPELQLRVKAIAGARGVLNDRGFDICNLRGHARDIAIMMPEIIKQCEGKNYTVIIPDPIYSMMGQRNENAANDMADFLNHLSLLSEATGAAVVYTHHFAKGNAAGKEQIDRASGSGVFSRHADGIITLTRHKEDNAFTVEAELRSFPRPEPFTIKWDFPRMERVDLDPKQLKGQAGAKTQYSVVGILRCLTDGMTTSEWKAEAGMREGLSHSTFHDYKNKAAAKGLVEERDKKWYCVAKVLPFVPPIPEPPEVEEASGLLGTGTVAGG